MAKIRVKFEHLDSSSDTTKRINTQVSRINSEFMSICNSLDWDIQSAGGIRTTANKINSGLGDDEQSLRNLSAFLIRAANDYRELDSIEVDVDDMSGEKDNNNGSSSGMYLPSTLEPYRLLIENIVKAIIASGFAIVSYTVTVKWIAGIPYATALLITITKAVPTTSPVATWLGAVI